MTDYDNTNTGRLFRNDKKTPENKQPDYRGDINVDGVDKQIAGWLTTSKAGTNYMSLKVSEPYVSQTEKADQAEKTEKADINVEDIPF